MWNQISAMTTLNLRSVPQRFGSSAVTVLGIAGVVVVFVGLLSMAQGFRRAMMIGGDPRTAIVLAEISVAAVRSFIPSAEYVQKIVFCLYDDQVYDAFRKAIGEKA